ncbi:MAG: hypothetical protein GQ527_05870, partial [Bacteroidales bacterium]|nr:hypothetical protein [Bacteroidales bacterium]
MPKPMKKQFFIFLMLTISFSVSSQSLGAKSNSQKLRITETTIDIDNILSKRSALEVLPPTNLYVNNLGFATWDAAEIIFPLWLQYDDGVNVDVVGGSATMSWSVAAKWDVFQLIGFESAEITKIKFFPYLSGETTITLKIWSGENAEDLVYEEILPTVNYNEWNEITLETSVAINANTPLWVGYHIESNGGYVCGVGEYTGDENSGMYSFNDEVWYSLLSLGYDFSWNIGAYVEDGSGKSLKLPNDVTRNIISEKSLFYNVYLNNEFVSEITDNEWQYQYLEADQTYIAGITAVFDDEESEMIEYEFDYSPPFSLDVSPDTLFVSSNSGSESFQIFSNTIWEVTTDDSWIAISPESGNSNATVTVEYLENLGDERQATIFVVGEDSPSCLVVVIQEGMSIPLLTPTNLSVSYDGIATWEVPGSNLEMIELKQHNGVAGNGYYGTLGYGYGVVFDLEDYTNVTLEMLDFRHSAYGSNGIWDYNLHIVDWETRQEIASINNLHTTLDNGWENEISLESLSVSGLIGVFMEPLSGTPADAYPILSSTNMTLQGMSYYGNIDNYAYMWSSGIGDFLMDLWIMGESNGKIEKAKRFIPNYQISKSKEKNTLTLDNTEIVLNQKNIKKELIGYKVYLDGVYQGETENLTWQYTNLQQFETYISGVSAIYSEGESDAIEYEFTFHTVNELIINPTSLIVSSEEGSINFEITSNTDWSISTTSDWFTLSLNEGSGNETISIQYDFNEGGVRIANIEISGYNAPTWKLVLTQAQNSNSILSPPYNVTADLNEENGEVGLVWDYSQGGSSFGFYEDFDDGVADNFFVNDNRISVQDGYFKVFGDNGTPTFALSHYNGIFSDFLLEAKLIRHQSEYSLGNSMGVIVRSNSLSNDIYTNHGYLIVITANGHYSYWKLDGTDNPSGGGWQTSNNINHGLDQENILSVNAHGEEIDIYINGVYESTIIDDSFFSGYAAIAIADRDENAEVWLDYISVGEENENLIRDSLIILPIIDTKTAITNCDKDSYNSLGEKPKSLLSSRKDSKDIFLNFDIYRNSEFIGTTIDTFLTNQLPIYGDYQYQISAVYEEGESSKALSEAINWSEVAPPTNTIVSILPIIQDVDSTNLFSTTIEIDDVYDVGHFNLEILFNSTLINVKSVELADFISSTGRSISSTIENINNEYGFIEYAVATSGDGIDGPNGAGVLLNIDWEVVGTIQHQTSTALLLKDVVILQTDSTDVPVSTQDATVSIAPNFVNSLNIADQIDIVPNPNNGLFKIN